MKEAIKNMNDRKEKNRKSNWGVGHIAAKSNEEKYAQNTSANQAFRQDLIANHIKTKILDKETSKLYMGSQGMEYTTTNKENFSSEQALQD